MDERDEQLLTRWRAGEAAAFETLFARCYPLVFRAAYALLGVTADAEDAAQEALLALYRTPPEPGVPLRAWLCQVALNRGRNAARGARRAAARDALYAAPDAPEPPELAAERAEDRAAVRAALATLPERQAQLLALRHAGLSYAEIAAALAIAPGSVGTLLARAERAFAAAYSALHPAPDYAR